MTITLTREEAQQVLDAFAWELGGEPIGTEIQKSVDLLRARLAQPLPDYSKAGFGQPQRKWQGLTDEEVGNFTEAVWPREATSADFIRAIEAKLKAKNAP